MAKKHSSNENPGTPISRRELLVAAAGGTFGLDKVYATAAAASAPTEDIVDLTLRHAFYGRAEQAGIRTLPQRYVFYMTFDLTSSLRTDLQVLLARWSGAIAQLMNGQPIGQVEPARANGVGLDSGEAMDLGPASLTVTLGLGPKVFSDTYGLAHAKPARLRALTPLPSDALDPRYTGGDLSLQACADDPQVAYHAVRDLARIAKDTGTAATCWTIMGFGRASAGKGQSTPRNLLGFKDGTRNVKEDVEFDRFVWVNEGPAWQRHGCYQVVRKIQMHIENWDTDRISNQNDVFGRHKLSGAPLT
ncbi:MAG: Dyp-type peroxidase, partial [Steroidobacteraceae bacterium]